MSCENVPFNNLLRGMYMSVPFSLDSFIYGICNG